MTNSGYFRSFIRTAFYVLCLHSLAGAALAAPKSDLWPRWSAHDADSSAVIDHSAWTEILQRYLVMSPDGINRVRYSEVTDGDRASLAAYLDKLAGTRISAYNRMEQRAFWINFYNALTVKLIIDYQPVDSIRDIDISPGLFSDGPWDKKLVTVEGEMLSLNDIEHRILRPIWEDPRIHYAVNCASIGCPNLMPMAFTAENSDRLLDQGAETYINHPRGVSAMNGKLVVSSIYHWFGDDFGDSNDQLLDHLRTFAAPKTRVLLDQYGRIDDHSYDWSLNGATN